MHNKPLKPTVTHVTPFAEIAKVAPRYGGLVPPFYPLYTPGVDQSIHKRIALKCYHVTFQKQTQV